MEDLAETLHNIISPFGGAESISPYLFIRAGKIVKVYASVDDVTPGDAPDRFVGKVLVAWIDRASPTDSTTGASPQLIPWSYAAFGNPLINKSETAVNNTGPGTTQLLQDNTGSSHGIFYVPSEGDLVICGFRAPNAPVILGYLAHNLYQQQMPDEVRDQSFGSFPTLISGEYVFRSLQQAQIYLDQAGAIQMTVREQPAGIGTPPIDTMVVPDTPLAKINLGVTYDETFTTPIVSSYGQNVVCNIALLPSGAQIQIDAAGNVTITGTKVNLNNGQQGAARLNDATIINTSTDSAFMQLLSDFITIFNTHTHVSSTPGNPTAVPVPLITDPAPTTVTGKINQGSSTVVIG